MAIQDGVCYGRHAFITSLLTNRSTSECCFASYLIRVKPNNLVSSEWVAHVINSTHGKTWVKKVSSQQVGQANINGTKLRNFIVPLPPWSEQTILVELITSGLQATRDLSEEVRKLVLHSGLQRQSILHIAFTGQLVSQDPNDEPASVLLERIRAERLQHGSKSSQTGRGRKSKKLST